MQQKFIYKGKSKTLIVFFSGFAQSDNLLDGIECSHDLLYVYDYSNFSYDFSCFENYSKIECIGWSLGVFVGACLLSTCNKVNFHAAINGSVKAIDESEGISPAMYMATADNLGGKSFDKFLMRICGGLKAYESYKQYRCTRTDEQLRAELLCIKKLYESTDIQSLLKIHFDKAYIGLKDRIFASDNLLAHFKDRSLIIQSDSAHYDRELFELSLKL